MTHIAPPGAVLPDAAVAVTGATGFIGARLVAMLESSDQPQRTRPLDRRRTDLRDPHSVRAALAGCRAVVHCAFDFADMDVNLAIARVLGRECAAVGARLVHVSTAAVYEPLPDGSLDETSRSRGPSSDYKEVKLAIEDELLQQSRDGGLDLVILQPTIVYGPFGRAWTDSPIRELLTGAVVLPDDGEGLCNAVYVDDVCRAIIAALTARLAPGERILVSGAQPVPWKDFYGAYQDILHLNVLQLLPRTSVAPGTNAASAALQMPSKSARRAGLKRIATRLIGARALSRVNLIVSCARSMAFGGKRHVATGPKLALFRALCHVRIDKARRLLGYEPEYDLEQGMRLTQSYVLDAYGRLARLRSRRRA